MWIFMVMWGQKVFFQITSFCFCLIFQFMNFDWFLNRNVHRIKNSQVSNLTKLNQECSVRFIVRVRPGLVWGCPTLGICIGRCAVCHICTKCGHNSIHKDGDANPCGRICTFGPLWLWWCSRCKNVVIRRSYFIGVCIKNLITKSCPGETGSCASVLAHSPQIQSRLQSLLLLSTENSRWSK